MKKIEMIKGRGKVFELFIVDKDGRPKDITGWSLIRLGILHDKGTLKKYAPKTAGTDEVQTLAFSAVPDAGTWALTFDDETTGDLAFDADNAAIQAAINALNEFSDVVVTGSYAVGVVLTFSADDGLREHPLAESVIDGLEEAGSVVTIIPSETTKGIAPNGVDVKEEKCGHLEVELSNEDLDLLNVANDQNIDLYVRIGTKDLDFDPRSLIGILDVSQLDC